METSELRLYIISPQKTGYTEATENWLSVTFVSTLRLEGIYRTTAARGPLYAAVMRITHASSLVELPGHFSIP